MEYVELKFQIVVLGLKLQLLGPQPRPNV